MGLEEWDYSANVKEERYI